MTSFLQKHVRLLKPYARLSAMKLSEYKFNMVTNTVSQVFFLEMWVVFWNVLLANVDGIGEWTRPMAIMLTGFVMLSDSIWQVMWASIKLYREIPTGVLDLYLVRPVQPIIAFVLKEMQFFSLVPALLGLLLIIGTLITSFEFSIVKLLFALTIVLCGVLTLVFAYMIIGCFAFWLGRSDAVRSFYRSLLFTKTYPTTVFPYPVGAILTWYIPISLFGTFPVLVLTRYDVPLGLWTALTAIGVAACWFALLVVMWKKGLERYESQGG